MGSCPPPTSRPSTAGSTPSTPPASPRAASPSSSSTRPRAASLSSLTPSSTDSSAPLTASPGAVRGLQVGEPLRRGLADRRHRAHRGDAGHPCAHLYQPQQALTEACWSARPVWTCTQAPLELCHHAPFAHSVMLS